MIYLVFLILIFWLILIGFRYLVQQRSIWPLYRSFARTLSTGGILSPLRAAFVKFPFFRFFRLTFPIFTFYSTSYSTLPPLAIVCVIFFFFIRAITYYSGMVKYFYSFLMVLDFLRLNNLHNTHSNRATVALAFRITSRFVHVLIYEHIICIYMNINMFTINKFLGCIFVG